MLIALNCFDLLHSSGKYSAAYMQHCVMQDYSVIRISAIASPDNTSSVDAEIARHASRCTQRLLPPKYN